MVRFRDMFLQFSRASIKSFEDVKFFFISIWVVFYEQGRLSLFNSSLTLPHASQILRH